jgi:hypothetical protein
VTSVEYLGQTRRDAYIDWPSFDDVYLSEKKQLSHLFIDDKFTKHFC